MIRINATVESLTQGKALLEAGVDTLQFGEETFALRMPHSFSREEQKELVELVHSFGKKATVAVNAIMHPDKMKLVPEYLDFLAGIGADQLLVGDPGVLYLLKQRDFDLPYIYAGETLVTSSRQINYWAKKGAVGAVLAREVPFDEMVEIAENITIPAEVLVYGATCIHHSKRPLLENYYQYKDLSEKTAKERELFLAEPQKEDTHYSIYEDSHGTHIFADNDVNLIQELPILFEHHYQTWKLDGIYTPGDNFVEVAKIFLEAKHFIEAERWSEATGKILNEQIRVFHPKQRGLDTGFFHLDPKEIK